MARIHLIALSSLGMEMQRLPPKHFILEQKTLDPALGTSIRSLTPISVDWTTGLNGAPLASLVGKHLRAGAFIWVTSR